ncbi:adenosylcobinamide-GDP ribazoletransferase [Amycolatopsis magusensis]|uniref:Adenosylcobinamide-GDP ribazoletransferase n=1 Tax=Amycolatopsis magusensis TaxID=882444 RepID=A0ABS4PRI1_9PSEU|nr:adenosylcobinamide-GDP ribazoletransferase [Amycolatopsis magusensis]MBP2182025.1 adenosylcobinamide-GDP ribazoletransferase [Amycolatopsis magusensis]
MRGVLIQDAIRMAVGTLTVVPVPAPRVIDARVARGAMLLAPLAVVPLAAAGALVTLLPLPALPAAALALGVVALGSRGLHLDGLSDTADGLSASYDRERALSIMRKGDSGPSGVATLVIVLLVQCGALAGAISAGHGIFAVVVAVLAGRVLLAIGCARGVPSARPEGLGATVAGSVPVLGAAVSVVLGSALAAWGGTFAGLPWWQGLLAVFAAVCAGGLLLWRCVRRLGGITGDVLGACVETGVTAALLCLAA